jgi:chromosomal replication initiation ATPase DnaA
MTTPKLSASTVLLMAEEKQRKRREAEELPFIRESILTGLLVDVVDVFNVPLPVMQSGDQQELTVLCRSIFYHVARMKTDYGLFPMAKVAGRKDHASVINLLNKVNAFFKESNSEFLTLWSHYLTNSKLFTSKDFPCTE